MPFRSLPGFQSCLEQSESCRAGEQLRRAPPSDTYHILQGGSTEHFEDRIGFGGGDAEDDGLLAHSGGVLVQRGSELPATEAWQREEVSLKALQKHNPLHCQFPFLS